MGSGLYELMSVEYVEKEEDARLRERLLDSPVEKFMGVENDFGRPEALPDRAEFHGEVTLVKLPKDDVRPVPEMSPDGRVPNFDVVAQSNPERAEPIPAPGSELQVCATAGGR